MKQKPNSMIAARGLLFAAILLAIFFAATWMYSGKENLAPAPEPTTTSTPAKRETETPPDGPAPTIAATASQAAWPLNTASTDSAIRAALLRSKVRWQSLFVDARVSTNAKGQVYVDREQVWLVGSTQSRWISGQEGGAPSLLRVTAGINSVLVLSGGERTEFNTLDPQIGELTTILFPQETANRPGVFTAVRTETIAGRTALVVEWSTEQGRVEDRFWIDVLTGILLKWQNLFPVLPDSSGLTEPAEIEVTVIHYDVEIPDTTFDLAQTVPQAFSEDFPEAPLP